MTEPPGRAAVESGDANPADEAAHALATSMWPRFTKAARDGWAHQQRGVVSYCSSAPVWIFNGVIACSPLADPRLVDEMLDDLARAVDDYCLQVRPGSPAIEAVALVRGMVPQEREPLMLLDDPGRLAPAAAVDGLDIRRLGVEEVDRYLAVMSEGFGAPIDVYAAWEGSDLLNADGVSAYVGSIGARDVATALGIVADTHVGLFNVAVVPDVRRQGLGRALSARTVLDGLASGARRALLMSSEMGVRVYERLGSRELEVWSYWVPADSPARRRRN